jgi:hypothetical protein
MALCFVFFLFMFVSMSIWFQHSSLGVQQGTWDASAQSNRLKGNVYIWHRTKRVCRRGTVNRFWPTSIPLWGGGAMGGHFYTLFQQYLIHFFPSACALLWTILYTLESHDIDDTSISIDGAHFHAIINNKYHSLCCLFLTCFSLVDL